MLRSRLIKFGRFYHILSCLTVGTFLNMFKEIDYSFHNKFKTNKASISMSHLFRRSSVDFTCAWFRSKIQIYWNQNYEIGIAMVSLSSLFSDKYKFYTSIYMDSFYIRPFPKDIKIVTYRKSKYDNSYEPLI